mmetsp:Transcript_65608/g.211680  ORF Transcript_65608/g.211680 Transcript_65608/m.211680 type:complete len:313 (-) Transcript_65608:1750-2688(-)
MQVRQARRLPVLQHLHKPGAERCRLHRQDPRKAEGPRPPHGTGQFQERPADPAARVPSAEEGLHSRAGDVHPRPAHCHARQGRGRDLDLPGRGAPARSDAPLPRGRGDPARVLRHAGVAGGAPLQQRHGPRNLRHPPARHAPPQAEAGAPLLRHPHHRPARPQLPGPRAPRRAHDRGGHGLPQVRRRAAARGEQGALQPLAAGGGAEALLQRRLRGGRACRHVCAQPGRAGGPGGHQGAGEALPASARAGHPHLRGHGGRAAGRHLDLGAAAHLQRPPLQLRRPQGHGGHGPGAARRHPWRRGGQEAAGQRR